MPHAKAWCRVLSAWVVWAAVMYGLADSVWPAERMTDLTDATMPVEVVHIEGLVHTTEQTLLRLLPRPIPGEFSGAELAEFQRRIRNLSLFDHVQMRLDGSILRIVVQEKLTLAPIVSITSGSSIKDLNATFGLVEYNIGGSATQLGAQFNYSQRGPNVDVWLSQHAFEPDRWAKELKGSYSSNGIRFADSGTSWTRNRIGGEVELKGPYGYGSPLRYEVVLKMYRESVEEEKGSARPADGFYVGLIPELTWDRYHWHDLVPSGYRLALEFRPGFFFGANQQRHEVKVRYLQAIPLGETSVAMINAVAEAVNNSGNPNHSLLLGSITGVRGLSDNLYRNRTHSYANVELRHAVKVAPRWALQGVLFSDAGAFESFTETGQVRAWQGAVNVGAGLRVIPTFLSNTLLRVDAAHLFVPVQNWLVQVGITQYF
ncbi:MAG: hypothetical protein JSR62_02065 [Nitrospira sp.]|nr:hypothetical protein [Nitrospira sp.]